MSKSRPGKKPLSSKVKTLNEQLARRRGIRSLKKRFLIVCEDTKSAPFYFEALKRHFDLDATSVRVAHSSGSTQPIQVVREAIRIKNASATEESGTEAFSQVWCVIDGDYGTAINNARESAIANDIQLAISNRCFEYWILLHFEESSSPTIDCDGQVSQLKKYIPSYAKGNSSYEGIVPMVDLACKRAEKLRQPGIERREVPENQNPSTEIYLLVNAIRESS